mgnify:CR=1 FL=1
MKNKQGISLIVLIVTIIVIIILAAAVILTLNNNNPIDSGRVAQLADNRSSINSAINLYYGKKMAETQGMYDASQIFTATDVDAKYSITSIVETAPVTENDITFNAKYGNYCLLNTGAVETATDVKLPTITNAKWYIDVNSGLVYLVYSSKDNVPSWMTTTSGNTTSMDQTLNEFVRVTGTDTLSPVTFSK